MTESKHTPGPWTLEDWPHELECMGARLGARAVAGADRISPAVVWGGIRESEANARLIAAAPDLLAALKVAELAINPRDRGGISLHDWGSRLKGATTVVLAAIAKAEGR